MMPKSDLAGDYPKSNCATLTEPKKKIGDFFFRFSFHCVEVRSRLEILADSDYGPLSWLA